jgi:hypothetical protein
MEAYGGVELQLLSPGTLSLRKEPEVPNGYEGGGTELVWMLWSRENLFT